MKKLLLLLMFIPLVSIGQTVNTSVSSYTENELVLSEKQIDIKTPITVDLSNYTHILIVKSTMGRGAFGVFYFDKSTINNLASKLSSSIFNIIRPQAYDKKRYWKQGKSFLKNVKDKSYLYMYYSESKGKGDDINSKLLIRDWENKLIYSASHINYGIDEVLSPITDF